MTCYACNSRTVQVCPRCGRNYCAEHGSDICGRCADPASIAPSNVWYRGSLLTLVLASAVGMWLLIMPPDLTGSAATDRGPVGVTGGNAETTATAGAGTPAPAATPGEQRYTVRPGDTLSSIAAQFGTSVDAIALANGFAPTAVLSIGQELKIPR